jgi:hypothetical protein
MSVTVACVLVHGHIAFSTDYVARLYSMVTRHMDRPFRFVCLTDRPQARMPPGVEAIRVSLPPKLKGWWAKVNLWKPGLFEGRVLYLDLDVLVVSSLAPVVDFPARMALVPDGAPNFQGRGAQKVVKRYNSSVMAWDAEVGTNLYSDWKPKIAGRLWGDQDWIGEQMPNEETFPPEWFPRLSATRPPWPDEAKVILCKCPKNHDAARQWPWFKEAWQ